MFVIVVVVVGCLGVSHHMGDLSIFELMISPAGSTKTLKDAFEVSSKDLTHSAKILDNHGSGKELQRSIQR